MTNCLDKPGLTGRSDPAKNLLKLRGTGPVRMHRDDRGGKARAARPACGVSEPGRTAINSVARILPCTGGRVAPVAAALLRGETHWVSGESVGSPTDPS